MNQRKTETPPSIASLSAFPLEEKSKRKDGLGKYRRKTFTYLRSTEQVNLPRWLSAIRKKIKCHLVLHQLLLYATYFMLVLWKRKSNILWHFRTVYGTMYCKCLVYILINLELMIRSNHYELLITVPKYFERALTTISVFSTLLLFNLLYCIHPCPTLFNFHHLCHPRLNRFRKCFVATFFPFYSFLLSTS